MYAPIVDSLLASPEPAIRWQVRTRVIAEALAVLGAAGRLTL